MNSGAHTASPSMMLIMAAVSWLVGNGLVAFLGPNDPAPQKAIQVHEIILRVDGSAVYDRTVNVDGVRVRWEGVIFSKDGRELCQNSKSHRYSRSVHRRLNRTVSWMLERDCAGLEVGQDFIFTYTPLTGKYQGDWYAGTVQPALEKEN